MSINYCKSLSHPINKCKALHGGAYYPFNQCKVSVSPLTKAQVFIIPLTSAKPYTAEQIIPLTNVIIQLGSAKPYMMEPIIPLTNVIIPLTSAKL